MSVLVSFSIALRDCCFVSPHSLHTFHGQTLQGGWVCFQFSPLPRPEKQHFQNQTNKTKKMRYHYFFSDHSVPLGILAHFKYLHDLEEFALITVYMVY